MRKIILIITVLTAMIIFTGCFKKVEHNKDTTYLEAAKAITNRIDIFADNTKIKADGIEESLITSDVYDKFGVIYPVTEREYFVNNEKNSKKGDTSYEFKTTTAGIYVIYVKKGDITSASITIEAE